MSIWFPVKIWLVKDGKHHSWCREELVGVPRGRQRSPWVRLDLGVPGHYRHGQLGLEDPQGGEAGRGGGLAPGSSLLCCRHLSDDKKIKKEEKVWS